MKSKTIFLVLIFLFIFLIDTYSQCAMCKASLESNLQDGDGKGSGINQGILYLMAMPYIGILIFSIFSYLQKNFKNT